MSALSSIAATNTPSYQPQQVRQRVANDRDGDGDNDATESAAAKAKESSRSVTSSRGNALNITA